MQLVIGLCGRSGAGKTTMTELFASKIPGVVVRAYADPLKDIVAAAFKWPRELLDDLEQREKPDAFWSARLGRHITPRKMLQHWGTDMIRAFSPDFWVHRMEKELGDDAPLVIISDIRFQNEADLVTRMGGVIIRIERDVGATTAPGHASEANWDKIPFDYVIRNNLDIDVYRADDAFSFVERGPKTERDFLTLLSC